MTTHRGLQGITPAATGWMIQHRCAEVDADLWFSDAWTLDGKAALRICHTCPVEAQCRAWALADETLEGIAGGLTQKERDNMRGPAPERCKNGHVRTDTNTRHLTQNGRPTQRCLTCDLKSEQRKGRAA